MEKKICLDDFHSHDKLLEVIYYLLNNWYFITLYSYKVNLSKVYFVHKVLWKLDWLQWKNINIRFVWFPFCYFSKKDIEKYFLRQSYYSYDSCIHKNQECLICKYYFTCQYKGNIEVKPLDKEILEVKKVFLRLKLIRDFFLKIGIHLDSIYFSTPFKFTDDIKYISREILCFIYIVIVSDSEKVSPFFLNIKDRKNLFLRNYIHQKRLNALLKNNEFSMQISHTNYTYNEYFLNNLKFLLEESKPLIKYINEWFWKDSNFEWTYLQAKKSFGKKRCILRYFSIKNIKNIQTDFSKYIIWVYGSEINLYLPQIYNFKNFIIFHEQEDLSELSHAKIVFRELGVDYLEWISSPWELKDGCFFDVDFWNKKIFL